MKQVESNKNFKVVEIELTAGMHMKRHIATSDACLIVGEGSALLIYAGETYEINRGETFLIPSGEEHMLKVTADFKAWIVLGQGAQIKYAEPEKVNIN